MMPVDAWEIVLGFMDAQTVFAADELGVFAALHEKPSCSDEIAEAVAIPEDSARRLLGALAAIGLTERLPDGSFRNTLEAENKLVPGKPGYIGSMFQHLRNDLYPLWAHVVDALREGRHQWHRAFDQEKIPTEEMYSDQEALRAFMEGMHCITHEAAVEFASKARSYLCDIDSIVDVGGASGAFLIALAEQYDHIEGTVFDLPQVEPIARGFFEAHGINGQLAFQGGDFFNDPLPEGADAYSLGFILHDWSTEKGSLLLEKISRVAPEGSLLILGEYLLDEDGCGPIHVTRSSLNMLIAARGKERTKEQYAEWIAEYGYRVEETVQTAKGKYFLISRKQTN